MDQNTLTIQLNSDKKLISTDNDTQRIIEIRLHAPQAAAGNQRPNLNLALVLDRSGSMSGEKLAYVKQAACHVLDQLREQDQVALVVYDDAVQVLSHSLPVTDGNRFELKQIIKSIKSGNMTNLCGGWLAGCKEIATAAQPDTINRTLLLTDGLANVGETDLEVLAQHACALYKEAVSTSTFGVGMGFDEHLLEAMSNGGGGNFYFIENPGRIPEIFLKEFGELVGISVRKVEVSLELLPAVKWQVLGGWSVEYQDGRLHLFVGDMLKDKTQDIYLKLQIPAGENSGEMAINARIFGQGLPGELYTGQTQVAFTPAGKDEVANAAEDQALMERYSQVELADSASEALKLERRGERVRASQAMSASIDRNRPYISTQQEIKYHDMSNRMRQGMDEADRKRSHSDSYKLKREKEQDKD